VYIVFFYYFSLILKIKFFELNKTAPQQGGLFLHLKTAQLIV
jgi:hypothetical protein